MILNFHLTMTYKINMIVFAFAAILMAMPLANSNAFGAIAGGSAELDSDCSLDVPDYIDFGEFSVGTTPEAVPATINATGTVQGTIELVAGDWLGVGQNATGFITLNGVQKDDVVTVNGKTYEADGSTVGLIDFDHSNDDSITAGDLAEAITENDSALNAIAKANIVIVEAVTPGLAGNDIEMSTTSSTFTVDAKLQHGEEIGEMHMLAKTTRYDISVDGIPPIETDYNVKTEVNVNKVIAQGTTPNVEIKINFQITGIDSLEALPYSGALTQVMTFTNTCGSS